MGVKPGEQIDMDRRDKGLVGWVWRVLTTPAATLSLAFLTLGGFLGGVMFWGAFNTALEMTNTEEFCVSCHEMKTTSMRN